MADVKMNPVFEGISRQIGDLVFMRKNGKTFVRRKGTASTTKTEGQIRTQTVFGNTVKAWNSMEEWTQELWESAAKGRGMTGYNLFMKKCITSIFDGEAPELIPEEAEAVRLDMTVEGNAPGEITCSLAAAGLEENDTLLVYTQESGTGKVGRHESGTGRETLTITGLNPAGEYWLHVMAARAADENGQGILYAVQKVTAGS